MTVRMERSLCAVLPLVLKGRWYRMIASGEKRAEYRDASDYWLTRIRRVMRAERPVVEFRLGYARDAPRMAFRILLVAPHLEHLGADEITPIEERWGRPTTPHVEILLGDRVEWASGGPARG